MFRAMEGVTGGTNIQQSFHADIDAFASES
jgi:hypothetical protein